MAGVLKEIFPDAARAGHFLSGSFDWNKTSEEGVIAANAGDMPAGAVLGRVTATGEYVPLNPAGADGSQNFGGILYDHVANSTATQKQTVIARDQVVNANLLTFVNAVTAPQKAAIITAAANVGVMFRY